MAKVYLATKQEVVNVEQSVTTLNTQINTASTGIDARIQALEGNNTDLTQLRIDVDTVDSQINDPITGLVKAVTDIDTQINEVGTGVIARLDDLEQGGTSTMKFRTHSPSGVYEDGEVVQNGGKLYKANNAVDGSGTSIPFVEGTGTNEWTELSGVKGAASSIVDDNLPNGRAVVTNTLGKITNATTTSTEIDALSGSRSDSGVTIADTDRFVHNDNGVMTQTSFARIWAWVVTKAAGAVSTILTSNLTTNRVLISNTSGKIGVANALTAGRAMTVDANGLPTISNVTTTELNKLDGGLTPENVQVDNDDGFLINIDGNLKQVRGDKVKEYVSSGVPRVTYAGRVNSNGSKAETYTGSFSSVKSDIGKYTISGLNIADTKKAMVLVTCTDIVGGAIGVPESVFTNTSFQVYLEYDGSYSNVQFRFTVIEWG
jgi:hypothetical protein